MEAGARVGEGQGEVAAGHLDFQHGDQAHIAIGRAGIGLDLLRRQAIGEGGVIAAPAHDLAVLVAAGPVQDVEGVGQVLRIGRAQLEVHKDGIIGVGLPWFVAQVLHIQVERVGAVEGRGVAQDGLGGEVNLIGDAVAVAVQVKEVWGAVVIGVAAGGGWVGCSPIGGGALRALREIGSAVLVRVRAVGVGVPSLAPVFKAGHLQIIADAIAVAVKAGGRRWVGAQAQHLPAVLQAVAVGIFLGGVCIIFRFFVAIGQAVLVRVGVLFVVGASGRLRLDIGDWRLDGGDWRPVLSEAEGLDVGDCVLRIAYSQWILMRIPI